MSSYRIPPQTHIGSVHLRVHDLQRSLGFYRDQLGLHAEVDSQRTARLSAKPSGPALYYLSADEKAQPRPRRSTGLYHVALRFPDRAALGATLGRLVRRRVQLLGAADHLVSEAIYLQDPDGNGLEIYCDRPRSQWPREDGQVVMATDPLDLESILAEGASYENDSNGIHPETDIGHLHLQVSDLGLAESFFSDALGMDVTQRSYPGALFFSAGGYHHHIGTNVWAGQGAPPPPPGALGLVSYQIILPDENSRTEALSRLSLRRDQDEDTVRDPDGTIVQLTAD